MFYKIKVYKWIKEINYEWRKGNINDVDYMMITDAILRSDKYTQFSFDFAMSVSCENHKRMKEYNQNNALKNCT